MNIKGSGSSAVAHGRRHVGLGPHVDGRGATCRRACRYSRESALNIKLVHQASLTLMLLYPLVGNALGPARKQI
jgi:hypothetical protein